VNVCEGGGMETISEAELRSCIGALLRLA
jgi:hypothetical protein